MKKFYAEYKDDELVQQLVAQVPWGHNVVLMDKVKDKEIRKIYLQGIIENGWGRSMLVHQIELNYHLRIGTSDNNFVITLPKDNSDLANHIIKDPYIFDFISLKNDYKEQELENELLIKIKNLLVELGKGLVLLATSIKFQWKIEITILIYCFII